MSDLFFAIGTIALGIIGFAKLCTWSVLGAIAAAIFAGPFLPLIGLISLFF